MKRSAFIIITHNNVKVLTKCIASIVKFSTNPYHIFLVDNASTDDTIGFCVSSIQNLTYIRNNVNIWWGGGINQGIKLSSDFDYIFFLNDDIEVYQGWDKNHIDVLDSDFGIGAVGPMDSSVLDWQNYDRVLKVFKPDLPKLENVDRQDIVAMNQNILMTKQKAFSVKGMLAFFCVAFKRTTIDKIGMLDEEFIMGGDDDDYCRRLDAMGFSLSILLNTYIIHHGGVSTKNNRNSEWKNEQRKKNIALLKRKHPDYYK